MWILPFLVSYLQSFHLAISSSLTLSFHYIDFGKIPAFNIYLSSDEEEMLKEFLLAVVEDILVLNILAYALLFIYHLSLPSYYHFFIYLFIIYLSIYHIYTHIYISSVHLSIIYHLAIYLFLLFLYLNLIASQEPPRDFRAHQWIIHNLKILAFSIMSLLLGR